MKVKAKHWLNIGGLWRKAGDVFEVDSIKGIEKSVDVMEAEGEKAPVEVVAKPVVKPDEPKKETTKSTTAKRRTRISK